MTFCFPFTIRFEWWTNSLTRLTTTPKYFVVIPTHVHFWKDITLFGWMEYCEWGALERNRIKKIKRIITTAQQGTYINCIKAIKGSPKNKKKASVQHPLRDYLTRLYKSHSRDYLIRSNRTNKGCFKYQQISNILRE